KEARTHDSQRLPLFPRRVSNRTLAQPTAACSSIPLKKNFPTFVARAAGGGVYSETEKRRSRHDRCKISRPIPGADAGRDVAERFFRAGSGAGKNSPELLGAEPEHGVSLDPQRERIFQKARPGRRDPAD